MSCINVENHGLSSILPNDLFYKLKAEFLQFSGFQVKILENYLIILYKQAHWSSITIEIFGKYQHLASFTPILSYYIVLHADIARH